MYYMPFECVSMCAWVRLREGDGGGSSEEDMHRQWHTHTRTHTHTVSLSLSLSRSLSLSVTSTCLSSFYQPLALYSAMMRLVIYSYMLYCIALY
jgi:hypothetical protein